MYQHRRIRLAALTLGVAAVAAPTASGRPADLLSSENRAAVPSEQRQDLRSPDAVDAAADRGTSSAPDVVVVTVKEPQAQPVADGIDWADTGIGAGASIGLSLVLLGGGLLIVQRRHARAARVPT
jgi:hypothetical protein